MVAEVEQAVASGRKLNLRWVANQTRKFTHACAKKNIIRWYNLVFFSSNNRRETIWYYIGSIWKRLRKFNYTILFTKYYIYTYKMYDQGIYLSVFVNKVLF